MIPILAIPILTEPTLLWKMLRSIDVPIGEIIIIDNGDVVHDVPEELPPFTHVWPGYNMGVPASWNHAIKMRPTAPWWMIAGFDVEFMAGDLERLEAHMEETGGIALLGGYNAFGLDRGTVRRVGLFDENYVPAYFEDNDYDYRCRLAGVDYVSLPAGMKHRVSSTLKSSLAFQQRNAYTFGRNAGYFRDKWGGGVCQEVFSTPFDKGGDPRSWSLDFDRLADQGWIKKEI